MHQWHDRGVLLAFSLSFEPETMWSMCVSALENDVGPSGQLAIRYRDVIIRACIVADSGVEKV